MKLTNMPDEGACITVHLRSGAKFTGEVHAGHVWRDDEMLCLAIGRRSTDDDAELLWQYIDATEVVAFTWDCRP